MARLASQAIAGSYPTPPHLLPSFASTFALDRDLGYTYSRPTFLDPCAGDGAAVLTLAATALGHDPSDAARYCFAIEMEATRAARLRKKLEPQQALHGDAFHFGWSGAASVLYLNPPYDTDRSCGRLEQRFLERFTRALAAGGALLFVVPHYALGASADYLASQYRSVHLWRFPDPEFAAFRQVLLVALRADQVSYPDPSIRDAILAAAADASTLRILDGPLAHPAVTVSASGGFLELQEQSTDVHGLLAQARPFGVQPQAFGLDADAPQLLGAPMPVALPARPAHIALALSAGMLNGRRLRPNDPLRFPTILAKGTLRRDFVTVDRKYDKEGRPTTETQIQQPRLDMHVLRLDTLAFQQLALGTTPTDAERLEDFTTADLLTEYGDALAELVREQLPALHDPGQFAHQLKLEPLARRPFRRQAECIQAGLKLLALGENPQLLAEVGTGKSTVALSIARHLTPASLPQTIAALAAAGFDGTKLRPVRRILIVCPPHLLDGWTDQVRACMPDAIVQVVTELSDLDREATVYILSRETAKLGPEIAGVAGDRCPRCSQLLERVLPERRAEARCRCNGEVQVPADALGDLARRLALRTYRYLPLHGRERWRALLIQHPAAYRAADSVLDPGDVPALALLELEQALCAQFEIRFAAKTYYKPDFFAPLEAAVQLARVRGSLVELTAFVSRLLEDSNDHVADRVATLAQVSPATTSDTRRDALLRALEVLLGVATWSTRPPCGEALFSMRPQPRRFPIARYILRRKARFFDLLILDEVHEFANTGSAQQKAAHRLVELPGVPTLALTGSLMRGYASSLFANSWALSQRFRRLYDRDDKAAFVARYGYRKIMVSAAAAEATRQGRAFGAVTDREDDSAALEIKQLGESPGVLPLFILEHLLPTALIMHKADLDTELPPCTEDPIAIAPDELDFLGHKLLASYNKLLSTVVAQIKEDRGTDRAGLLFGAMAQLPNYLDLAAEDCGPFEVRYPEDAGGELVATGDAFPVRWRSPKEQWLLGRLRDELAENRRVLLFLRNTGNVGYVRRILRLLTEEFAEPIVFLDPRKVPTAKRERWLNEKVIRPGYRILAAHPTTVQTGLNNLTAFSTAIWYQGTEGAIITRQANGRPHRIGQTQPVRILCPFYSRTLQKAALDHHARMITAALQVDGLSLTGALEAAGASSDSDREHAAAALSLGKALYEVALRGDR